MIVMHMSGAYLPQNFFREKEIQVENSQKESKDDKTGSVVELDCRDIPGTNCYLDDVAKERLREMMHPYVAEDIHFLDSGNYHYLSLLWLEKVKRPFSLILFDHHPDMQPPSFGMITSCGGWVLEALENLSNLQKVYMVGVDEDLFLKMESNPKVQLGLKGIEEDENPIYISFDKDVLKREDAVCDWDQGEMSVEEALKLLREVRQTHEVFGMDVCGEDSKWQQSCKEEEILAINDRANRELLNFWECIQKDEIF